MTPEEEAQQLVDVVEKAKDDQRISVNAGLIRNLLTTHHALGDKMVHILSAAQVGAWDEVKETLETMIKESEEVT